MAYTYRDRDPTLPEIGWRKPLPTRLDRTAVEAIAGAEDPIALGMMRGALASYAGSSGGVVLSLAVAGVSAAVGNIWMVAVALGALGVTGLHVVETRRRVRQWLGVVDARVATMPRQ
jgi:hypothetical protein